MYPASLTKIMTVIIAIQELPFIYSRCLISDDTIQKMYNTGASVAGYRAGEWARIIDLMYGSILPSGGECCITLAEKVAGSEEQFVELMNKKATELGMQNTHFTNCTGLHSDNHYSTAKDIVILLNYALKSQTFREIFTSHSYHTSIFDNKQIGGITFTSTLFNYKYDISLENGEILGGKTGYTDEAGYCLASIAEIQNKEYIVVSMNASEDGNQVNDAKTIYNSIY